MSNLPPNLTLSHALLAYNQGNMAQTLTIAAALRQSGSSAELAYVEAMATIELGDFAKAEQILEQDAALLNSSSLAQAFRAHAEGRIHLRQNRARAALPLLAKAIEQLVDNQSCFIDYAATFFMLEGYREAKTMFGRALSIGPATPTLFRDLGVCASRLGQHHEAVGFFSASFAMQPTAELASLTASAHYESGAFAQARQYFRRMRQLGGDQIGYLHGIGECYNREGKFSHAIRYLKRALDLALPDQAANLCRKIAYSYDQLLDLESAIPYCQRAILLEPNQIDHYFHLLHMYQMGYQYDRAFEVLADAERLNGATDDTIYIRGYLQLLTGKWEEGFKNYEARWRVSHLKEKYNRTPQNLRSTMWDGQASLEGKVIMVFCEQGAGDYFQFSRFCRELAARGAIIDLLIPEHSAAVMKTLPWARNIHTSYEQVPPHDYHVSMMSLPLYFGMTLENLKPMEHAYLRAPEDRPRFSDKFTVALTWKGDSKNVYDYVRSMRDADIRPLLEGCPNVQFVALQYGPRTKLMEEYFAEGLMIDGMEGVTTFNEVASALTAVDLLVAVETANVHLAGAMHVPTWVMLSHYNDWRWLDGKATDHWYKDMRNFRQSKYGDWKNVVTEIVKALNAKTAKQGERANETLNRYKIVGV